MGDSLSLQAAEEPTRRPRPDLVAIGAVAVFAYFLMVGDPAWRDTPSVVRVFNALLVAGLVGLYVVFAPGRADRLDKSVLVSLLLFAVAAIFSAFPRQSFDSVLAALAYVAALFIGREVLARPSARRIFVAALMALSVTLTILTAGPWLSLFFRWWALTDWSVVPPLGMNLPSSPWGHRHDLALLLAMLYPAWWVGRITPLRAVAACIVGVLGLAAIVIGGSRMVWLGIAGGSLVVVMPILVERVRWTRATAGVLVVALAAAALVVGVTGLAGPILERVFGGASLAERTAMWGPLVEAWAERPLVGHGAGSFPWLLQMTDYFDTHSFSPRHPDSAPLQLLAEAGAVGILALIALVVSVLPAVLKGRSQAATWALVAFGLAALAGNPTDFEFMVAVAVAWLAFTAPHEARQPSGLPILHWNAARLASAGALCIVGLAFAATVVADVAYTSARTSIEAGRLQEGSAGLRMATVLDPSLAIYPRQLGTLHLLSGETGPAIAQLERAVDLNPQDDLAWRTLALARAEGQDTGAAVAAVERALEVQRSDPANLLTAVRLRLAAGDEPEAVALLSEAAQAWPEVAVTPEWEALIGHVAEPVDLLLAARDRWTRGAPSPEPLTAQVLLLDAWLTPAPQAEPGSSRYSSSLAAAYLAVMSCDEGAAEAMSRTSESDRRVSTYWALVHRLARMEGRSDERSARIYGITGADPLLTEPWRFALNPLHENGARASSADRWGYRRFPITWPPTPWDLPSPRSGLARVLTNPRTAGGCWTLELR